VNIRIIAASNRDLQEAVRKGGDFVKTSNYRPECGQHQTSALKERRDDIPFLVNFFVEKYNEKHRMKVKGISQRAMNLLRIMSGAGM